MAAAYPRKAESISFHQQDKIVKSDIFEPAKTLDKTFLSFDIKVIIQRKHMGK